MNRTFRALLIFCFHAFAVFSQRHVSPGEYRFAQHLYEEHLFSECIQVINDASAKQLFSSAADSLHELKADCFLKMLQYDSAGRHFQQICCPYTNKVYLRSHFMGAYSYLQGKNYNSAYECIDNFTPKDSAEGELKRYAGACGYLLEGGSKNFEYYDRSFSPPSSPYFVSKNKELRSYALRLKKAENKSMLLAGLMSAVVPGTGKIYAGKVRSGLTSIVPIAVMGLQTWEAYKKDGWKSPRFIVFGSVFSLFYIGNIWGSALSVSVRKHEIQNEVRNEVLVSLRISLQHVLGEGN